jgi:hypothetical protein
MDYVPITIDVVIHMKDHHTSVMSFTHPCQSDSIRFSQFFQRAVAFLKSAGMHATSTHQAVGQCFIDDFDDFEDDCDDSTEASWAEKIDMVLTDICSPIAGLREQAFQGLARWAEHFPASHVALAQGFTKSSSQFALTLLTRPLAERYPASAMLRSIACGHSLEARQALSASPLLAMLLGMEVTGLPSVVAQDIEVVVRTLQSLSIDVKKPGDYHQDKFASNSTRCTDLESLRGALDDDSTDSRASDAWKAQDTMDAHLKKITFTPECDLPLDLRRMCNATENLFMDCEI